MEYPVVDMQKTGRRIRELMKQNNIKTKDIVEFMGFESEQSVYKWLRGDSLPKVDNLFALSRLFGTSMDGIIMEREGEDESPLLPRFRVLYLSCFFIFLLFPSGKQIWKNNTNRK